MELHELASLSIIIIFWLLIIIGVLGKSLRDTNKRIEELEQHLKNSQEYRTACFIYAIDQITKEHNERVKDNAKDISK